MIRAGRMVKISLLAIALVFPSCAFMKKTTKRIAVDLRIIEDVHEVPLPQAPEEYKEALNLLREQKFEDALRELEEYVRDKPTSFYVQSATLNIGRALEGLGRWSEASTQYRGVIIACEKIAPKLQAMALYRLSFCHEALADDGATVAVLKDLMGRTAHLPVETARAELPARLASAYARVGNFDEALTYYKKAESGITVLRRALGAATAAPDWLPRTLYFMGSMSVRRVTWEDFESALRPLSRGQAYLLQAAELGMNPWSERAAQDLISTYRGLWRTLQMAPIQESSDPLVSRRQVQERQWDRASLILENLHELRARFLPNKTPNSDQSKSIESFSHDIEKEVANLLAQRPVGEGLTPEALVRKQRLRGQVISPDSSLEQRFLENSRLGPKLPATHIPDKTSERFLETPKEDPNQ